MAVNADKPHLWKADVTQSIEWYNDWFARCAPRAYQDARLETAAQVEVALQSTAYLTSITAEVLRHNPRLLSLLRLTSTPPLSRERLGGLAQVSVTLITGMEREGYVAPEPVESLVDAELQRLGAVLVRLADRDIFPWLAHGAPLTGTQVRRAALIVADRLCVVAADAIVREAHKQRQLMTIRRWLERRGYTPAEPARRLGVDPMLPGTFAVLLHLPVLPVGGTTQKTIPIDVAVMPADTPPGDLPLLIAARVAADAVRARKKRLEDVTTVADLRSSYGRGIRFILFLCGYFDSGYLGHAAAEGIDWVWEHRIDDLAQLDGVTTPPEACAPGAPPETCAPEQRSAAPAVTPSLTAHG